MFYFARLAVLFVTAVTSALAGFPAGRCYERACNASPYNLRWTEGDNKTLCFQIDSAPCNSDSKYGCCDLFAKRLNKIVIGSPPVCKSALKAVTVNGVRKGGGVYFDLHDGAARGELRLTNLNMDSSNAVGTTICIKAEAPCDNVVSFCDDGTGRCRYAIFDVVRHECCPTCTLPSREAPPVPVPPSTPQAPEVPYHPLEELEEPPQSEQLRIWTQFPRTVGDSVGATESWVCTRA